MEYRISLPRFVLDKRPNVDHLFPIFEDEKGNPIPAEFVIEPTFPTIRPLPWVVIRQPETIRYMAGRYASMKLRRRDVPDFLGDTLHYANVNILRHDNYVVDLEKVIPDYLLNAYGDPTGELERGWWKDFLRFADVPPKQQAQVRMRARYSLLALGLLVHDLIGRQG